MVKISERRRLVVHFFLNVSMRNLLLVEVKNFAWAECKEQVKFKVTRIFLQDIADNSAWHEPGWLTGDANGHRGTALFEA
eukprot:CAMPEP_0174723274 /NCGR_PEP_ID=MMETSP1094-20130205/40528_1 /TAXON_ID=156173 /ORGANISM="Chrysochromulina brevifilum, Strain UTEX LB 985" /LENGTH=79 /DNA_ID=CAMNT_0015924287 /DNA_START=1021 /DNA_END=1260 /DNA_ORIENTATION=-